MVKLGTIGRNGIFTAAVRSRARSVGRRLSRLGLKISVCESCTGGLLGALLTEIPGSSRYFAGGIVAYADRAKEKVVGVRRATLARHGAVSAETSLEMARRVRAIFGADIGVAVTGIAGPSGGSKVKPVGLVYVTACDRERTETSRCLFRGGRQAIRLKACRAALELAGLLIGHGPRGKSRA